LKVVFAGTPDFAAGYLSTLIESDHEIVAVITQPDKPGRRGKSLVPSPVKKVAVEAQLPIFQPDKLSPDDLNGIDIDVMIVVAYGQILKSSVLELPRFGCINVHASLLPRWRGAAPIQRALLAGDTQTGVTLIQMDAGLDTGDMLATHAIDILSTDTSSDLFQKMSEVGHPLLLDTLEQIYHQSLTPIVQSDDNSTYAKKTNKAEALIDWQCSAKTIDRQIRAFNPEPIAFTFLAGRRVKVHEATPVTGTTGAPGELLSLSKSGLMVGCGESALLITRLQLPLGKGSVLTGNDMMNGYTDHLAADQFFSHEPTPEQTDTNKTKSAETEPSQTKPGQKERNKL
jgi:methionyl-tRNA formyltransferase